jgi:two-component system OmpR family response regulator
MAAMTNQEHVLIVDDDAEIRSLLGDYLRENGYRVTGRWRLWAAPKRRHRT